jgi:hypothetical protein
MQRLIIAAGEAWDQTGEEGIACVPTRKTRKNNSYFSQTSRVLLILKGEKGKERCEFKKLSHKIMKCC